MTKTVSLGVTAALALTLAAVALILAAAGPAQATFPAQQNGKIAYVAADPSLGEDRFFSADVYSVNPDGTEPINLTDTPRECRPEGGYTVCAGRDEYQPHWSPDGTKIAHARWNEGQGPAVISLMQSDGSGTTNLTAHPGGSSSLGDGWPAWAPNGRKVAFLRNAEDSAQISVVRADGSKQRTSFSIANAEGYIDFDRPVWSPDSKKLAFAAGNWGSSNTDIYVVNCDGSELRRITSDPGRDTQPDWSPDGERILFQRGSADRPDDVDIFSVAPDGSAERNLTNSPDAQEDPALAYEPSWSPDGHDIVFIGSSDGGRNTDVYTMQPDGSGKQRLTDSPERESFATWSPDGRQLAFARERRRGPNLFKVLHVMDANGGGQRNLGVLLDDFSPLDWQPLSTTP